MSETQYLKLYLTDDNTEKFLDWRNKINGADDSNMVKIDTAVNEKANKSTLVQATLLSSGWLGEVPPYTQTIDVEGLEETQNGNISLAHEATADQREAARNAMLAVTSQEAGKLTIAADGELPETDIPVYVVLLG